MNITIDWVIGFLDGRARFLVHYDPSKETLRQALTLRFEVPVGVKDTQVLYGIKKILGCGVVKRDEDKAWLVVEKDNSLKILVEFLLNHPLKTKKNIVAKKFRRLVLIRGEGGWERREEIARLVKEITQMTQEDSIG